VFARGLQQRPQADAAQQAAGGARDAHDVAERRLLGIEVEHRPVRFVE